MPFTHIAVGSKLIAAILHLVTGKKGKNDICIDLPVTQVTLITV
jgi:hypothetical protein